MTSKTRNKIQVEMTENQLREIANACEYLGRHLINQPNFKALVLEDWIDDKVKQDSANTLLDIRKVYACEYIWDKSESGSCMHNYKPFKMGKDDFISIKKTPDAK